MLSLICQSLKALNISSNVPFDLSDYSHVTVLVVPSIVTEVCKSQQPPTISVSTTIRSSPFVEYEHIQVFLQEANETAKATTANVNITFFIIHQCSYSGRSDDGQKCPGW